jgi:uncharacterized protein YkwD
MGARLKRFLPQFKALGENIAFGSYKLNAGKRNVLALLVDDGVPSRGHRTNLFSPNFNIIGSATGPHNGYESMFTQNFGKL